MAEMNGQTPEAIASQIIAEATEPVLVELDAIRAQQLDELIRYKFSKKIYSKGERWLQKNLDNLRQEYLESIIESFHKSRVKADEKQTEADNMEYYKLLVSRGMSPQEALFESGIAVKPSEPSKAPEAAIPVETALENNQAAPKAVPAAEVAKNKK